MFATTPMIAIVPWWLRLVPVVGLMLLLARWLGVPRGIVAPRLNRDLTEASIVTLATLFGVIVLMAVTALV